MEITEAKRSFILHWGEMGSRWGINRATAQVHALLLVSEKPLNAESISEALSLARSNVSTALRDLQTWKIVKLIHVLGDRREYFQADKEVWQVLSNIAEKRIENEILPTITLLKQLQEDSSTSSELKGMFGEFVTVFEGASSFFNKIRKLPTSVVRRLLKFDRKIEQVLSN